MLADRHTDRHAHHDTLLRLHKRSNSALHENDRRNGRRSYLHVTQRLAAALRGKDGSPGEPVLSVRADCTSEQIAALFRGADVTTRARSRRVYRPGNSLGRFRLLPKFANSFLLVGYCLQKQNCRPVRLHPLPLGPPPS